MIDEYNAGLEIAGLYLNQFVEDISDLGVGIVNSLRRVELTDGFINSLAASVQEDDKRFRQAAISQYGTGPAINTTTFEGEIRVGMRLSTRYNGLLKTLNAAVDPYVQKDLPLQLRDETKKKLVGLVSGYLLYQEAARQR